MGHSVERRNAETEWGTEWLRHRVSIVVPTLDGAATLPALLDAVAGQQAPFSFEVVAVDSGSADGSLDLLEGRVARLVRIERASFDHGLTRNRGIEAARGELVVLTVQDAVPASPGWLASLVAPLLDDSSVAGTYARQVAAARREPLGAGVPVQVAGRQSGPASAPAADARRVRAARAGGAAARVRLRQRVLLHPAVGLGGPSFQGHADGRGPRVGPRRSAGRSRARLRAGRGRRAFARAVRASRAEAHAPAARAAGRAVRPAPRAGHAEPGPRDRRDGGGARAAGGVAPAARRGAGARRWRSPGRWGSTSARATRGRSRRSEGRADARADRRARLSARGGGGTELYTHDLVRALAWRFADEICVLTREDDPSRPEYAVRREQRDGIEIVWINHGYRACRSFEDSYRHARVARIGAAVAAGWRPDVAHVHHLTHLSTKLVPDLARRGVPVVCTLNDYWLICHRGQLFDLDERRCEGRTRRLPAVRARRARRLGRRRAGALVAAAGAQAARAGRRRGTPRRAAAAAALGAGAGRRASAARLAACGRLVPHVSVFLAPRRRCASGTLTFGIPGDKLVLQEQGIDQSRLAGLPRRPEIACASASSGA